MSDKWVQNQRKLAVEKLGGKCIACGFQGRLEMHHSNPYTRASRGGKQQILDYRKDPSGFLLLCRKCHEEFHVLISESELMDRLVD